MKKKRLIHFSLFYSAKFSCACSADGFPTITDHRDRVTCKRCKITKRFRKIK